jgi:hypothetical protein
MMDRSDIKQDTTKVEEANRLIEETWTKEITSNGHEGDNRKEVGGLVLVHHYIVVATRFNG